MASRFFGVGALAALVGVVTASGCGTSARGGGSSDEPSRSGEQAIQGGTPDSTHTFEMGVCGLASGPGQCQLICTGTLIAPNLVVTARHCVSQTPMGNVDCASTNFGGQYSASQFYVTTNANMFNSGGTWVRAKQIITPAPTPLCGNDIALIILSSNVPASAATPAIPNVMYDLRDRSHISKLANTAIGYGLTSPQNMNSAGSRNIRQNIQFNCIPSDPSATVNCWTHGFQGIMAEQEFYSGDGPCEGDSGSGAFSQAQFDQGTFLSLGVLSRGGVSPDGTTCQGSFYTRLDSYRDLILSTGLQAAQQGGYSPLPWMTSAAIPPLGDGGTKPPADSGTPTDDSGTAGPLPGQLGATCSGDGDCDSMNCAAPDGKTFVCTQSCDTSNACPSGFSCKSGFCFADPASSTNNASGGKSGGCALAPAQKDPSKPIPWLIGMAGVAFAAAGGLRRRRRNARDPRDRRR